jgi:hypothetical protein
MTSTQANYGTIYGSAAIDSNDSIYLAYTSTTSRFNSPGNCVAGGTNATGPHSLSLRVLSGGVWTHESISNTLVTRYAYPKVIVTDDRIHVVAIEDEFKVELNSDTSISPSTNQAYCSNT